MRNNKLAKEAFLLSTNLDDVILLFENCTCQRTLLAVVQPVWVCAVLNEESDEVGVAMVCGEHELRCPVSSAHRPAP